MSSSTVRRSSSLPVILFIFCAIWAYGWYEFYHAFFPMTPTGMSPEAPGAAAALEKERDDFLLVCILVALIPALISGMALHLVHSVTRNSREASLVNRDPRTGNE